MAERLEEACNHASHVFWPEQISLLNKGLISWERMLGPWQVDLVLCHELPAELEEHVQRVGRCLWTQL